MRRKRKVSISCLGGRLGICLLLAFVPQLLFAQVLPFSFLFL